MTGTVIELRPARPAKGTPEAHPAPMHPALRWIAGGAYWVAHRRSDGRPVCGAPGDLILASPDVPLCTDCYPQAASGETA